MSGSDFPFGTMVINLTGSFVLGLLTGSALHHGVSSTWLTVVGTGLIGAYTTFSTFTFDTVRLAEAGPVGPVPAQRGGQPGRSASGPRRRAWPSALSPDATRARTGSGR